MTEIPKKYARAMANLLLIWVIILVSVFVAPKIILLFMPFVFGWFLALLVNPAVCFLEHKLKVQRKAGAALVIVFVIAVVCVGVYWTGSHLMDQAVKIGKELPEIWQAAEIEVAGMKEKWSAVIDRFPKEMVLQFEETTGNLEKEMSAFVGRLSTPAVDVVGNIAQNIPGILMAVIMCLLSAYFFVAEREFGRAFLKKYLSEEWNGKFLLLKKTTIDVIIGYVKAQFKIEIWIYLVTVAGLIFLKVRYGYLVAIFISFLDILPVFGTGAVLLPWAIFKVLNGQYMFSFGLLCIWGVTLLVRQIIQPKLIGDSMGISPLPTLVLLYLGYKLAGIPGMVVAVPFGILVLAMNDAGFFDNGKNSVRILWDGLQGYRQRDSEELEKITKEK